MPFATQNHCGGPNDFWPNGWGYSTVAYYGFEAQDRADLLAMLAEWRKQGSKPEPIAPVPAPPDRLDHFKAELRELMDRYGL